MTPPVQQALDADRIYRVLRHGTAVDRRQLVESLPPAPLRDAALALVGSDQPGMVVVALGSCIIGYCAGSAPREGAQLALAVHRLALELVERDPEHGLLETTLSGLASSYVNAANLLGDSAAVVRFTDRYIPYYEELPEPVNLRALKLGRATALLNLHRVDEAAAVLEDPTLPGNPATDIELTRLRRLLATLRGGVTRVASRGPDAEAEPDDDPFVEAATEAVRQLGAEVPGAARIASFLAGLGKRVRLNPKDPADFDRQLDLLRRGERILQDDATGDSELSIRARVREACGIFVRHAQPPAAKIAAALADLEYCRQWAAGRGLGGLENDALWGVYLCHSRSHAPSPAADALLALRGNLERARAGVSDPLERGGAFTQYPHLFGALAEKLHAAGRVPELLDTIEGSKGRAVADLLTRRSGQPVADAEIYGAARVLPELCATHDFSYLTFFVDDEVTYAVLVTPAGEAISPAPLPLGREAVREAAAHVDPRAWGSASEVDGGPIPDSREQLAPLVSWLEPLLSGGAIRTGGHVCIAADDDLANVPFAYLPLGGVPLVEVVSLSRIHNAHHLAHVLAAPVLRPSAFLGVVTGTASDVARARWPEMRAHLLDPVETLARHLPGEVLVETDANLASLLGAPLTDRVIHFSTHGIFPSRKPDGSPYEDSGLVLSNGRELPDVNRLARGDMGAVLTPRRILESDVDLRGSHASLMACVSGLSREGIGGDALGMEWALIQAGAASMLASHWHVSARLAARFINTFYDLWLGGGRSRARAWTETIAELRSAGDRYGEPAGWAAFSLTGDWR